MTESDWLECTDSKPILEFERGNASKDMAQINFPVLKSDTLLCLDSSNDLGKLLWAIS